MKRFQIGVAALISSIAAAAVWAQQPQQQPRPAQSGQLQPPSNVQLRQEAVPAGAAPKTAAVATTAVPGLANDKQKTSYGLGLNMGGRLQASQVTQNDLDTQAFVRGLLDALNKAKPALDEQELQTVMINFSKQMEARMQAIAEKNKKEGQAFLATNKTKEGVKTTASGLQYKVVKAGTGVTPTDTDIATVNYKGTLLDGTVFDSSEKHGGPATFPVGRVIPGWSEALKLMKVGDRLQLFVPSELGYGEEGSPSDIGPNAMLVFDVELLDVKKGGAAPAPVGRPQ